MMKTVAKILINLGLVVPFLVTVKHMTANLQLRSSGAEDATVEHATTESIASVVAWTSAGMYMVAVGVILYLLNRRKEGPTQSGQVKEDSSATR